MLESFSLSYRGDIGWMKSMSDWEILELVEDETIYIRARTLLSLRPQKPRPPRDGPPASR